MRTLLILLAFLMAAAPLAAQLEKLVINTSTPEGVALQQITQETDLAKKTQLMEQFVARHADHAGAAWVWSQLQAAYNKTGQFDKAIAAGEKVLAADPGDVESAYQNLKASEGKKDAEGVKTWSALTSRNAKKLVASQKPAGEDAEEFAKRVDYARQVDIYTEYSLYATALQLAAEPQKVAGLGEELERRNAGSQYLAQLYPPYFMALRQLNDSAKVAAVGERAFSKGMANEDMLLVMADFAMSQQKDTGKSIGYSNKLVEIMSSKPKPDGVSDADWDKKKAQMLGVGNWMSGVNYSSQQKWAEADKSLRAAMPYIKDNAQLLPAALFHLGLADYSLAKASKSKAQLREALGYTEQCAAMDSPLGQQAAQNAKVIRAEMAKPGWK